MAQIYPLFSSSSGNSCFIGSASSGILIDAGTSCRRLLAALSRCDIPESAVKAIFITHDHSDHISALRVFTKGRGIPVYASKGTLTYLVNSSQIDPSCEPRVITDEGEECAGFYVKAYHTPHDAIESVFYRINTPDGKTAAVCTDLGFVSPETDARLRGCDLVMLESNYDERMLRLGSYPAQLKKRISSELGHLSNPDSAKEVKRLVEAGTQRIILGHLSRENNTPELAERTLTEALGGLKRNRDYLLTVAPVETAGLGVSF